MKDIHLSYKTLVQSQQLYFKSQTTKSIEYRMLQLNRLKSAILEFETQIADALHKDLGKSYHEAVTTEIGFTLLEIKTAVKNLRKWSRTKRAKTNLINMPSKSYIVKEPYGINLIIGPWNYPFQLAIAPLIGAIAGGNTAIIKPSELAPHTAQVIQDMIKHSFPSEYIAVVQGGIPETNALLDERFDLIFFTGSTNVGRIIMEKAAKHLTPVILELGGKSPVIIDNTADIEKAVKRIIFGKATNSGQTCVAPDYLIIHEEIKEAFYQSYEEIKASFYGADLLNNPDYGRMINEKNYHRVKSYISDGRLVSGGTTHDESLHIDLTLIEVSDLNTSVMKEEIFGPILPIVTYRSEAEIYDIINRNPDPLALYVFSHNKAFIQRIIAQVPFGGGCINDTLMHLTNDHLPFGGRGTSGLGNYHGKYSFDAFTHNKAVLKASTRFDLKLKYPPFSKKVLPWIKRLMY